jgi:hypothetical protein
MVKVSRQSFYRQFVLVNFQRRLHYVLAFAAGLSAAAAIVVSSTHPTRPGVDSKCILIMSPPNYPARPPSQK